MNFSSETEIAIEEARQIQLVHHWESASLSASMCSSTSRSLQNTPVRQAPLKYVEYFFKISHSHKKISSFQGTNQISIPTATEC